MDLVTLKILQSIMNLFSPHISHWKSLTVSDFLLRWGRNWSKSKSLANETNNICAQGRYHCERCESRIRTENISTINSVQLPCMIVVEQLNFHRQNRRHIRRTETPINSTVILGNREYKLVGAAYFGNSHYCSLRIHPDNTIYENDGLIEDAWWR